MSANESVLYSSAPKHRRVQSSTNTIRRFDVLSGRMASRPIAITHAKLERELALRGIVKALIERKCEGTYWDFKRIHQAKPADLVHDVLALANAAHDGDRYLIFGVDESSDYRIRSIACDSNRRSQADIASLFRDNAHKFFQSRYPSFYLREIAIESDVIDVLVIPDSPHKPFYLVADYKQRLPRNCIYTRVCDTNTPYDQTAAPHEIERMWRDRFGIGKSPGQRLIGLLNNPEDWEPLQDDLNFVGYYCSLYPEFTIRGSESQQPLDSSQEWTRAELVKHSNNAAYYDLYYHQTLLGRINYVSFDDHKKFMVAPDWKPRNGGRFYYYESNTLRYAVQKFFATLRRNDHSRTLLVGGNGDYSGRARDYWSTFISIPVLHPGELGNFLGDEREGSESMVITDLKDQYQVFLRNQLEFEHWRNSRSLD